MCSIVKLCSNLRFNRFLILKWIKLHIRIDHIVRQTIIIPFLKLLFTTMTNHNLFYDIKVKIWSANLSCMWWKKLLKRSLRKIRVSTPFKRWYIYIILSILNVDLKLGQKKVILKHLTSYYKCISTAPIDSCMYNFMKTETLSLN